VLEGGECLWVSNCVLQGLLPGLDEGIVIAAAWAGIAASDQQGVQEDSQRDPTHGIAVIRMDDLRTYSQVTDDALEESSGVFFGFGCLDGPADDASVEQFDDRVGVGEDPVDLGFQPGYVP